MRRSLGIIWCGLDVGGFDRYAIYFTYVGSTLLRKYEFDRHVREYGADPLPPPRLYERLGEEYEHNADFYSAQIFLFVGGPSAGIIVV